MSRIAAQLAIEDTNLHRSFSAETELQIFSLLNKANEDFIQNYPGDPGQRQPVHTFYGGAHLFKSDTIIKLSKFALGAMQSYASDFTEFAKAIGIKGCENLPSSKKQIETLRKRLQKQTFQVENKNKAAWLAFTVYNRVLEKLTHEPIEDYRIDFEDGFGYRTDAEEDHEAMRTAFETARAMEQPMMPPNFGIRIKSFSEELKKRAVRTLDIYLTALCEKTGNRVPENFVVTLPKVVMAEQVTALVQLLIEFERQRHLQAGSLKLEIMMESPQVIFGKTGTSLLLDLVKAGEGRCVAVHFGPYDYTTGLGISSQFQTPDHAACDFARHVMQVSLAGTGIRLSDGANHTIPAGPHRETGKPLTAKQKKENREAVHRVWKDYFRQIQRSLAHGFYQSWDLHPAHLPVRYASVYAFFLEGLEPASFRMQSVIEKGNQAALSGQMFDDAASGQGLLNYFLRAFNCGAITADDVRRVGLTTDEIKSKSFSAILNQRRSGKKP